MVRPDIDVLGLTYRDAIHQECQGSIRRHFQNEKSYARIMVIISQQTKSSETLYVYTNRIFLKQISVLLDICFRNRKCISLIPVRTVWLLVPSMIGIWSIEEIIQGRAQGAEKRRIL